MDLDRIPDRVLALMDKFAFHKNSLGDVKLAGGAPRDLFFDKPINDWDFFIPYRSFAKIGMINQVMYDLGFIRTSCHDFKLVDSSYENIAGMFQTATYSDAISVVQLVFNDAKIDEFDMSICQISIDMEGNVETTTRFDISANTRTHWVFLKAWKSMYQLTHGLGSHVPRVLAKYPWTVILDTEGTDFKNIEDMRKWHSKGL